MPTQRHKPRIKREKRLRTGAIATTQGRVEVMFNENETIVEPSVPIASTITGEGVSSAAATVWEYYNGAWVASTVTDDSNSGNMVNIQTQIDTSTSLIPLDDCCNCENCDCDCKEEEKNQCICKDYEGQNYFCNVHAPAVECPKCHCVNAEIEVLPKMVSIWNYRCKICGIFYSRNEESGEYTHY